MRRALLSVRLLVVVMLLFLATGALAQSIINLQIMNPPSNNVLDGIYVGAYSAKNTATGAVIQMTCDDFKDESDYSKATYTVNTFNSLGSTLWGSYLEAKGDTLAQVTTLYDEAAWLDLMMLKQTGKQEGYSSYAIWAVFDPTGVASWLTTYGDSEACKTIFGNGSWANNKCSAGNGGLLATAAGQHYYSGEFSNFVILTPRTAQPCSPANCPEQEFLEPVSEGGSTLVYLLLAGTCCFGAMLFSRSQTTKAGLA